MASSGGFGAPGRLRDLFQVEYAERLAARAVAAGLITEERLAEARLAQASDRGGRPLTAVLV